MITAHIVMPTPRRQSPRPTTPSSEGRHNAQVGIIAETLEYLETVEPLLREAATLEVVTTVPVGQVADIVVAHCL